MADNTVKIDLQIASQGMDPAVNKSQTIRDNLTAAGSAMARVGGTSIAGGTPGSRAVSQKSENQEYAAQRAVAGATGASARNFAAESQGLGGLVRLYATWAANIYAVGAAFKALSDAADTTNMIKGMDQLGVASGIALGSLAKKFADATGGAISLQEAASATTKALSAGLSTKQFEEIGEVATKASRALGINMGDAVSRLTRGITKLEPELLDELGLFTKLGQASEEYAKRVGKSVTSLTDFEKRQAFANAVLKEGRDKYANINIEANPYDRLASSIKNLTQNGLELVNKVLGPIISLLSTSPTALAGVMAGLGLMLVKQAIPAIGQYRASLTQAADEATKKWQKRSDDIKKIEKDQYQYIIQSSETQADARLKAFEKAEDRIAKLRKTTTSDTRAQSILGKQDYRDVTKEDIKYLKDLSKQETAAGNTAAAKQYNEAANALRYWIKAEEQHLALLKQIDAQVAQGIKTASPLSATGYARDQLESARKGKARSSIVSNVAADVSVGTFGEAWKNMNKAIKDEKLTGLDKGLTKIGSAAVLATTGITRAASALTGFLGWIGLVTGAITTLYGWISTNRVEEEKLAKSIEYASEVTKTATGTFAKFSNVLTTESLLAKANAMGALGDSVSEQIAKFSEFDKASDFIDNAWESAKRLFGLFGGFSKKDYLAESVSKQIMAQLDNLSDPELKKTAETKLKKLFNIDSINRGSLEKGIKKSDSKQLEKLPSTLEEVGVKSKSTTLAVTSLADGFKQVDAAFLTLSNTLISSDPLQKYAQAVVTQSKTMTQAFKDTETATATLGEILKDNTKLEAFPPEAIPQIMSAAHEYKNLSASVAESEEGIKGLKEALAKGLGNQTAAAEAKIAALKTKIEIDKASLMALSEKLKDAAATSMEYGFKIAASKASSASQQAAIDTQKTLVSLLPKTDATIRLQMQLELSSIRVREKEITAIYNLTQAYNKTIAKDAVDSAKAKIEKTPVGSQERKDAEEELRKAKLAQEALNDPNLAKTVRDNPTKYENTPEVFKQLSLQSGYSEQMALFKGQETNVKLKAAVDRYAQAFDEEIKASQTRVNQATEANKNVLASEEYARKTLEQQSEIKDNFIKETEDDRKRIATAEQTKALAVTAYVAALPEAGAARQTAKGDISARQKDLDAATKIFNLAEETSKSTDSTALRQAIVTREYKRQEELAQQTLDAVTLKNTQDLNAVDLAQQQLDTKNSLKLITAEDYDQQTNILKSRKIELDYIQQLLGIDEERRKKLVAINEEIAKAGGRDKVEPGRLAQLDADRGVANQRYADQRAGIDSVTQGLRDQQTLISSMNPRMKAYSDIFESSIDRMTDALMEFAKTGKLNFKDLITSMIADLVKYEIKLQMMEMWAAARPAVMGFIKGIFGGGGGSAFGVTPGPGATFDISHFSAKGSAYDQGVQKFAQGGTFSNSVVNSPTLFKFAKGTGLMGEAGPEAIMPLKRDSAGKLGVSMQGSNTGNSGKVEVVVNNFGSEKATTKETQDSRGNRKIEVMIGDLSAGEMSRSGSNSQRAMQSTYGLQPQLIRR